MNILSLATYPEEGQLATRLIQGISTEEHKHLIALHKSSEEYLKMKALENQLDQCFDAIPDSSLEEYYKWEDAFRQHPAAIKLRELIWSKFTLRPTKWVGDRTNYLNHPSRLPSREVRKRCRQGECLHPQPLGEAYAAPKLDMAWKMPLEQLCFILDNKETKYKVCFEKNPEMIAELKKERNSVAWGQDRHWYNAPLTMQEELEEYIVSTVTIRPLSWFSRYFETAIFNKQDRGVPLRVEKSYHLPMAKMMHEQLLEDAQVRL